MLRYCVDILEHLKMGLGTPEKWGVLALISLDEMLAEIHGEVTPKLTSWYFFNPFSSMLDKSHVHTHNMWLKQLYLLLSLPLSSYLLQFNNLDA